MKNKIDDLKNKSFNSRNIILEMGENGGCFIGSAFSCIDIITYIYNEIICNSDKLKLDNDRDYFLLSKGHAVPALYATFAQLGYIDEQRIKNYNTTKDYLYLHPNVNVNGIEFHSGSLGHMLSIAAGIAIDIKRKNKENKVIVLLGDGELDEGSNWEALLNIYANKLNNLIIVIDRNKIQANFNTEKLIPLEPLKEKFEAFKMKVREIDGHNFEEIDKAFCDAMKSIEETNVIIANTIRGKGIPSIENDWESWFMEYDSTKKEQLKEELINNYSEEN